MTIEPLSRRVLLERSATGLGLVIAGDITGLFGTGSARAGGHAMSGYGPLIDDPAGLLSLPAGFSYEIVAESGVTTLETGEPTPSDPDGTAAFKGRGGGSVLVNNHEVSGGEPFPVPAVTGFVYDPACGGGTTTIEVDGRGRRVREYVSLAGTLNNCAGGITPWGTWLTCEEAEALGPIPHGYVFEVDPYNRDANRNPKPIKALGRYAHESVVVEPGGGNRIYLTEDAGNPNGLLYRWTPPKACRRLGPGVLKGLADDAGTLEAMRAFTSAGTFVPDLSVATEPGTTYKVQWVAVPDRDAKAVSTRKQFTNDQITRSRKLEGMWWEHDGAYFVSSFARTADGSAAQHDGQVWFIDPRRDTIELRLHFAYTPADQDNDPDGPDNITVSPYGGLILAEDGEGKSHLVGSTPGGDVFFFARNDHPDDSEFTGPTFSHNRQTLFANIQSPGHVFAIQGPFRKQR
jgi:secreted PhoX family phosphatase